MKSSEMPVKQPAKHTIRASLDPHLLCIARPRLLPAWTLVVSRASESERDCVCLTGSDSESERECVGFRGSEGELGCMCFTGRIRGSESGREFAQLGV